MNETEENKVSEEDNSSLIGVDPLAWLSDEEKQSVLEENKEEVVNDNSSEQEENSLEDESDKTTYTVNFENTITIRDVEELMDEFSFIDASVTKVVFECAEVDKTDAAAMQLLTAYYLFAMEEGKEVVWNNPSEMFCHSFSLLGLNEIINLSLAA
ncbi:MAG: STAS domain-containing protein [Gammaproteobacteria bacterium]|jgi:anti-anti-sigma regulatory factor